jgi:predicted nucleic-acid-binding protein
VISVDTNILTRFYVAPANDSDRAQQALAQALIESNQALFVPVTVALELFWVLSAVYEADAAKVKEVFEHLTRLPNISVEDEAAVTNAAAWHAKGIDFADALHLAKSASCSELVTFDARRFARRAGRMGLKPPRRVLPS